MEKDDFYIKKGKNRCFIDILSISLVFFAYIAYFDRYLQYFDNLGQELLNWFRKIKKYIQETTVINEIDKTR